MLLAVARFYSPTCLSLNIKAQSQAKLGMTSAPWSPKPMKQEERAVQEQLRSRQAGLPPELEPGKGHLWAAASNMKTEEARLILPDPSSSEL